MIEAKILEKPSNNQKRVIINQKQICSFYCHYDPEIQKEVTILRLSSGDEWIVIEPPFEEWLPDAFISDVDY